MDAPPPSTLGEASYSARQQVSECWALLPQERSESPTTNDGPGTGQSVPKSGHFELSNAQVMSARASRAFSQPSRASIHFPRTEQQGRLLQTESVDHRKQRTDETSLFAAPEGECVVVTHARLSAVQVQSLLNLDPNPVCISRHRVLISGSRDRTIHEYDGPADGIDLRSNLHPESTRKGSSTSLDMSDLFDGRTLDQLERGVQVGLELIKKIAPTLQEETGQEVSRWSELIDNVQSQAALSKTVIGVLGATGSGKSSIINAIIDEECLVPTSCLGACTAVVTEISYNHQGDASYIAEVEFISKEEWRRILDLLFQDLVNSSGQVSPECTNKDSEAGIAYAQVKAVYPRLTKEEMAKAPIDMLMGHENVAFLGTKRNIESEDVTTFYKDLQRFVSSKIKTIGGEERAEKERKPHEMEVWPLIRVVKLHVKSPVLATGAVIVDLPGLHDSNPARAAVARDYLKQCSALLIVAPVARAVDDKTAQTLLGDSFKRQLKMDGGLNSVTFVCSKTDDISVTEAQDSLGLGEELGVMWAKQRNLERKREALEKQIQNLENSRSEKKAAIVSVDDQLEILRKWQFDLTRPKQRSAKRKFSDLSSCTKQDSEIAGPNPERECTGDGVRLASTAQSDYATSDASSFLVGSITADEISRKIPQLSGLGKHARQEEQKIDGQIQELRSRVRKVDKEHEGMSLKITARCIAGRNHYSRQAIRQDYVAGIREMDQELAEEEDAENFDPEVDARDYDEVARNLSIFCVSSRAYQKLKGRLPKDPTPPGFLHPDDTELPALQAHCVQLTATARQATSRKFLTSIFQLLNSLRLRASDDSPAKNPAAGQLDQEAQFLEERLNDLKSALKKAYDTVVDRFADELEDEVRGAYRSATKAARAQAMDIVRTWNSPINREDPAAGGLWWPTYKAVVRRDGCFTKRRCHHNFNGELLEPLIRRLARPWEYVFTRALPVILMELPSSVAHEISTFHNVSECHAVRNGASVASFEILKQQIPLYQEKLKVATEDARNWSTRQHRACHRQFEPIITAHMRPVYVACNKESGQGSFYRMKAKMEQHVEKEKKSMFDKAIEHVDGLITRIPHGLRCILRSKVDIIFKAIQGDYTSVLARQKLERRVVHCRILRLVNRAELDFKHALGLEAEPYATATITHRG